MSGGPVEKPLNRLKGRPHRSHCFKDARSIRHLRHGARPEEPGQHALQKAQALHGRIARCLKVFRRRNFPFGKHGFRGVEHFFIIGKPDAGVPGKIVILLKQNDGPVGLLPEHSIG